MQTWSGDHRVDPGAVYGFGSGPGSDGLDAAPGSVRDPVCVTGNRASGRPCFRHARPSRRRAGDAEARHANSRIDFDPGRYDPGRDYTGRSADVRPALHRTGRGSACQIDCRDAIRPARHTVRGSSRIAGGAIGPGANRRSSANGRAHERFVLSA